MEGHSIFSHPISLTTSEQTCTWTHTEKTCLGFMCNICRDEPFSFYFSGSYFSSYFRASQRGRTIEDSDTPVDYWWEHEKPVQRYQVAAWSRIVRNIGNASQLKQILFCFSHISFILYMYSIFVMYPKEVKCFQSIAENGHLLYVNTPI